MRILLLIDSLGSGGAQRQIAGLAALMQHAFATDAHHSVKVATYHDIPFYADFLHSNGVKHDIIAGAAGTRQRIFRVWRYLKKEKPDVVISYLDTPSAIACICRLLGCRYRLIVSERNTTQQLSRRERVKFFLYRFADAIVPNSFSQQKFIATHYPRLAQKVNVITNFVDTDHFSPLTATTKPRQPHKPREIICVGRVSEQKNILRFIDAVAKVRDADCRFHITWYGIPFPSYLKQCQEKIKQLRLESYFEFRQPDNNIRDRYRQADIFCLPSIYEGFPNVLCEAMSCGLPVLCSNVCDNPDIARHDVNALLFNPLDTEEMASSLCRILAMSSQQLQQMGEESRRLSLTLFSSATFLQKYLTLIGINRTIATLSPK